MGFMLQILTNICVIVHITTCFDSFIVECLPIKKLKFFNVDSKDEVLANIFRLQAFCSVVYCYAWMDFTNHNAPWKFNWQYRSNEINKIIVLGPRAI